MKFHNMVDMKRDPDDIEETAIPAPDKIKGPAYPWGLCLRFDEEVLEKLGFDGDLPNIGEMIHIRGMGEVTSARAEKIKDADDNVKTCRCIEIQLTHLAAEDEDREDDEERLERNEARDKARSQSFYDDDEDEAA